jgi:hypothetical protein
MREDRDNVGPLPPEEDSGNQPEFVSADIEDYASPGRISMWVIGPHVRNGSPMRLRRHMIPVVQRLLGSVMTFSELLERSSRNHVHVVMFAYCKPEFKKEREFRISNFAIQNSQFKIRFAIPY